MTDRQNRIDGFAALLAGLGFLDVDLAHRARDDEIVLVQRQCAGDAVLVQFERHRVDRRLFTGIGFRRPVVVAYRDWPPRLGFELLVGGCGIRLRGRFRPRNRLPDHRERVLDLLAVVRSVIDHQF